MVLYKTANFFHTYFFCMKRKDVAIGIQAGLICNVRGKNRDIQYIKSLLSGLTQSTPIYRGVRGSSRTARGEQRLE